MKIIPKIVYTILRKSIKKNFIGGIDYESNRKRNVVLSKFANENQVLLKIANRAVLKMSYSDRTDKIIIYLHGGAYVSGIEKIHIILNQELTKETDSISYILDYSLAPEAGYKEVHNELKELYSYVLEKHPKSEIIFIGDSAGGGLALSFTMSLKELNLPVPHKLVLISPWLDISMTNKKITKEINDFDPILAIDGLIASGDYYRKELDNKNYLVSPVYGSLENLPKMMMFSSTHDILQFDCDDFYEKCQKAKIDIKYHKYEEVPHDFVIIPMIFKETKEAILQIIDFIK